VVIDPKNGVFVLKVSLFVLEVSLFVLKVGLVDLIFVRIDCQFVVSELIEECLNREKGQIYSKKGEKGKFYE